MRFIVLALIAMTAAVAAGPVHAATGPLTIVNRTGGALSAIALRRVGDTTWTGLGLAAAPGASVRSDFRDPDCAFDLGATLAGTGPVTWSGLNLCDVKRVTLNRDRDGRLWVDYD